MKKPINIFRQNKGIQFYIGAAVPIVGGFGILDVVTMWRDIRQGFMAAGGESLKQAWFVEHVVLSVSIGVAVFACAFCGYFLLRHASESRLRGVKAGFLFVLMMLGFVFVPPLLMFVSQTFRPDIFRSDSQMCFYLAPAITSAFLLGLFIPFTISLFLSRHSQTKLRAS